MIYSWAVGKEIFNDLQREVLEMVLVEEIFVETNSGQVLDLKSDSSEQKNLLIECNYCKKVKIE